jgi:hypothetical protein
VKNVDARVAFKRDGRRTSSLLLPPPSAFSQLAPGDGISSGRQRDRAPPAATRAVSRLRSATGAQASAPPSRSRPETARTVRKHVDRSLRRSVFWSKTTRTTMWRLYPSTITNSMHLHPPVAHPRLLALFRSPRRVGGSMSRIQCIQVCRHTRSQSPLRSTRPPPPTSEATRHAQVVSRPPQAPAKRVGAPRRASTRMSMARSLPGGGERYLPG